MPEQDRHVGEIEMTDARFPERWMYDRRLRRLSADSFRLFMMAMAWSVSQRTDGVIDNDDLHQVPYIDPALINDLEANGLWRRDGDRWIIEDFSATQTNRRELERLEAIRRADRERKSRQRTQASSSDVPPDNPRDVHVDTPRQGQAKARPGEEDLPPAENPDVGEAPDDTTPWGWPAEDGMGSGWEDVPCDQCGRGPTRLNTVGRRLCGGCGPVGWTTDSTPVGSR